MTNVPNKRVGNDRGKNLQPVGDKRRPNVVRKLATTGRKNPNMGASIRGRQQGGGFPPNQV